MFFLVVQNAAGELAVNNDLRHLSFAINEMFFELNNSLFVTGGSHREICDLTIDVDGTYSFKFDYGSPKRLNGIFDGSSYDHFINYLVIYKAELANAG